MTSVQNSILAECAAIACCPPGPSLRSLERLAAATGFGQVVHYQDMPSLRNGDHKVLFFLVHFALVDGAKADLLHQVRAHASHRIRFAPVVLVMQDCDAPTFLSYVQMGFDDILCLPDAAELLRDRMLNQLNHDVLYIETADYLGPDRRRMEVAGVTHAERVSTSHMHTRLIIHRSLADGPTILSRQDYWDTSEH